MGISITGMEPAESTTTATAAIVAIEIGGTKLQIVSGDAGGRIDRRWRAAVQRQDGGAAICRQIEQGLRELTGGQTPAAIGVGFGGPVHWRTGRIACSHHIDGWNDFDLRSWLAELAQCPIVIENDSNVAALGEANLGSGKGFDPVFYTNMGSGVGGGLVVDGRIYHGAPPGEVEFGHLRLDRIGTIIEDRCSGWAVDKRIRQLQLEQPQSLLARLSCRPDGPTGGEARFLGPALDAHDPAAVELLRQVADDMGFMLSHVIHLMHPQVIVLGGGLSQIGKPFRDAVAGAIEPYVMQIFRPLPEVRLSALGEDVVPIGAMYMARVALENTQR